MNFAQNFTLVQILESDDGRSRLPLCRVLHDFMQENKNRWPGTARVDGVFCGPIESYFSHVLDKKTLAAWSLPENEHDPKKVQAVIYQLLSDGQDDGSKEHSHWKEESEKILKYSKAFYVEGENFHKEFQVVGISVLAE